MITLIPSPRLFRYISRSYLLNFAAMIAALLGIIYIFEMIELLRRAAGVDGIGFDQLMMLGAFKLPSAGQVTLPFAVMFAAVYTCWKLTRTQEIVVMRAAGLSAWQFLTPMVLTALCLGFFATGVVNPLSAALLSRYAHLEARILKTEPSHLTIARTGIWLRQPLRGNGEEDARASEDENGEGYALMHADGFDEADWRLTNITLFMFDNNDTFTARLESRVAYLRDGYWEFRDTRAYQADGVRLFAAKHLATHLTPRKIEETFSEPKTISYWAIPEYVNIMEEAGFPTTRLRLHFHMLSARPVLFAALILLAATFSLRPQRFGGGTMLIGLGVLAGFFVFFTESMLQAFGLSQKIPVLMAAWTPALLTLLLGAAALLHTEDG